MATATKGRKSGKGRKMSAEQRAAKQEEQREKVAGLVSRLQTEVEQLATGEGWSAMVQTLTQSNIGRYSFNNQLLLLSQAAERGISLTTVYGFKTWKNLGRHVRKGEKGLMLLAPREFLVDLNDEEQTQRGEIVEMPDGTRKRRIVTYRTTHVWDISQTDGYDDVVGVGSAEESEESGAEADAPSAPSGTGSAVATSATVLAAAMTDLEELRTALEAQITARGYEVRYAPTRRPSILGSTVPARRTVTIRPELAPAQSVAVVAHELAHIALGHTAPSYDYHDTRNRAEIEAESVAYVLLAAADVEVPATLPEYVAGWAEGDMDEVRGAAEAVTRTAVHLLDAMAGPDTTGEITPDTP